jgi:hypothetical protein
VSNVEERSKNREELVKLQRMASFINGGNERKKMKFVAIATNS